MLFRFLGHSLTSFGHDTAASGTGIDEMPWHKKEVKKPTAEGRFSIGFALLANVTKRHSSQKWRNPTGLKDAGRFHPATPSCALLFPPYSLARVFPLLWPRFLIPRLTLGAA